MAYPTGYRPVTWNEVETKNISQVYILEDGRDKPYGPYKVINAKTRELEDPAATYDKHFFAGVNEVIGVPDPSYNAPGMSPAPISALGSGSAHPAAPTQATFAALAAQAYDALFDAFVLHLATKGSQIDAVTRMQLESDLVVKRNIALKALIDALKR